MYRLNFPENFLWGTATAGHQVEGHNINSDWWQFEEEGKIKDGTKSGKSVDYWNKYEEDHLLMQQLGYKAFRLGIEWAKIQPQKNVIDKEAINHYKKILSSLKEKNIKICLTIYHWVLPLWVAQQGGWENENTIQKYLDYAKIITEEFGEYPFLWVTINEPLVPATAGYLAGEFPPEKKDPRLFAKVIKHLLLAHSQCYKLIHKNIKNASDGSPVKVGIAQAYQWIEPWNSGGIKTTYENLMTKLFRAGSFNIWDNTIKTGVLKFPFCRAVNIPEAKDSYDYSGINYYFRMSLKFDASKKDSLFVDFQSIPEGIEKTQMGWQVYPRGLYLILKENYKKFKKPIYILENGIADDNDKMRPRYLLKHLAEVQRAIRHSCDIRGYFQWSFIDNFEWKEGFCKKFGLIDCDFADSQLQRKPRPSAYMYSEIIKQNAVTNEIAKKYSPESYEEIFKID